MTTCVGFATALGFIEQVGNMVKRIPKYHHHPSSPPKKFHLASVSMGFSGHFNQAVFAVRYTRICMYTNAKFVSCTYQFTLRTLCSFVIVWSVTYSDSHEYGLVTINPIVQLLLIRL